MQIGEGLSFKEELSEIEIKEMIQALDDKLENENYDTAFQWAEDMIREYPNCYQLMWQFAAVLDARYMMDEVVENEKYPRLIVFWYETVLKNGREELQRKAAGSLFEFMFRQGKYNEAEKYLEYYDDSNSQKRLNKGRLSKVRGDIGEAYKIYEQELFSAHQLVSSTFAMLYMLAMETDDLDKAKYYMEKQSGLAKLFEMGKYYEVSGYLDIYCKEENIDKTLETAKQLLQNVETLGNFRNNRLYMHMEFSDLNEKLYSDLKEKLIEVFRDKESFRFMEGNEEWEKLLK